MNREIISQTIRKNMMMKQNTNYAYKLKYSYNTCPHLCEYCYANASMEAAVRNYKQHEMNLLGETITGKQPQQT